MNDERYRTNSNIETVSMIRGGFNDSFSQQAGMHCTADVPNRVALLTATDLISGFRAGVESGNI